MNRAGRRTFLAMASAALCALAAQGPGFGHTAIDPRKHPVTELRGRVEKVQITPGAGMPSLMVQPAGAKEPVQVVLGSMRYLIEQNFNPKAGNEIEVRGFQVDGSLYAATVSLPAEKRTLKLREDDGTPVWRRYGWGQPRRGEKF